MVHPTTAIILNGGAASRMRPLSSDTPKCLISFLGRPLLDYLLESLRDCGISDVVLTSAGPKGELRTRYGDGETWGLRIRFPVGAGSRGTAGCIRDVVCQLAEDIWHPVLVVYGDSLLRVDFRRLIDSHPKGGGGLTILTHRPDFGGFRYEYHDKNASLPDLGPRTNFGMVDVGDDGLIERFVEKELLCNIPGYRNPAANAAVYVVSSDVWCEVPSSGSYDFARDLFPAMLSRGERCLACPAGSGEYRIDVGILRHYHAAQMAWLEGRLRLPGAAGITLGPPTVANGTPHQASGTAAFGRDCTVAADARVCGVVAGQGVTIHEGAKVTKSVLLDRSTIGPKASVRDAIVGVGASIERLRDLPPGTAVGNDGGTASFAPMSPEEFARLL